MLFPDFPITQAVLFKPMKYSLPIFWPTYSSAFMNTKLVPCPPLSCFFLSLKIHHSSNASTVIQLCQSSLRISQRSKMVLESILLSFHSGVKRLVNICLKPCCFFFKGLSQWERAALLLCCLHHLEDVTGCSCKCFWKHRKISSRCSGRLQHHTSSLCCQTLSMHYAF